MARKPVDAEAIADAMPQGIEELKPIVEEFVNRLRVIENEIKGLGEDKKALVEEFSDRLDTKTLKQAIRTVELRDKVANKDTYDTFLEILESDHTS